MAYQTNIAVRKIEYYQKAIRLIFNIMIHVLFYWLIYRITADKMYPNEWNLSVLILSLISVCSNCIFIVSNSKRICITFYIVSIVALIIAITPERDNYLLASLAVFYVIINGSEKFGPAILWITELPVSFFLLYIAKANLTLWGNPAPSANYQSLIIALIFVFLSGLTGLFLYKTKNQRSFLNYQVMHLSQSNELLANSNVNLQGQIVQETTKAINSERIRISREIHDTAACTLINTLSMLDACRLSEKGKDTSPEILDTLTESCKLLRNCFTEIRNIISETRQEFSPEMGLLEIKELVDVFQKSSHVNIYLNYGDVPSKFDRKVKELFFRAVQEGLTNAIRHGYAQDILVSFHCYDGGIELTIRDNGIGAESTCLQGFGLQGMQERVSELNGTLSISTSPGMGFCLRIWVPVNES